MQKTANSRRYLAFAAVLALASSGAAATAQTPVAGTQATNQPSYADIADLGDSASLVIRVKVKKQAEVEAARAPGLRPGFARLFIEADTVSLLAGNVPVGGSLKYLVDVPRDSKGRAPKLRKQEFLVFAKPVPNRPGELQLVDPQAQIAWSPEAEQRVRPILAGLYAPDALPAVTGIRDALSVAGNLAGESETQIFLLTRDQSPLALTIIRRPGMAPVWGYSQSEIVDQAALAPRRDTVAWYRLACSLPATLPPGANLASDARSQQQAVADYAFVLEQLGRCERNRS